MVDEVRCTIEAADIDGLRELVRRSPGLANLDVRWGEGGKSVVPPLHFVCDAVARGLATQEQALEMADVLVEAGVDPRRD